jgi:hypothetical protein
MPPISQRLIENDCANPAKQWTNSMSARHMLLMATPVNRRVNEDILLPCPAMPSTSIKTNPAPQKAPIHIAEIWPECRQPKQIAATAPSDAPLDTPSV